METIPTTKTAMRATSLNLPETLIDDLDEIAAVLHRSRSAQVAFLLAPAVHRALVRAGLREVGV